MNNRPFLDKSNKPTHNSLKTVLKEAFHFYENLSTLTSSYKNEWNHSKSGGWIQKIHDNKKSLLYFIPLHNSYMLSLSVRENEKEQLLNDKDLKDFHDTLIKSKKYVEGYAMQFLVKDKETADKSFMFISKIIALRK